MKKASLFVLFMVPICVCAESFLTAQNFPKTIDDLSFIDKITVLSDGYDMLATEYVNGKCVSGCAYPGITIQEEIEIDEQNTADANTVIDTYQNTDVEETHNIQSIGTTNTKSCSVYSATINSANKRPIQAPVDGNIIITSDFGPRNKPCRGCSENHRGIDIAANVGTNVYSPAAGVVTSVWNDTKYGGGLSIKIKHADGFETSYAHLSKQLVSVNDRVGAGCLIAKTGNTGNTTGAHLHYMIKYNGKPIDPLYKKNYLGRSYKFANQSVKSRIHRGKTLPGEIK